MDKGDDDRVWGRNQVAEYTVLYPLYQQYAVILQKVLERVAVRYAPQSIIQTRPKTIVSFAEKIWRKKQEFTDPVHQFTDLCGGRIITTNQDEVHAISQFIEQYFNIDWENSVDVSQRLKPSEFGYRSVHYIVQFRKDPIAFKEYDVSIPEELFGHKAEIQVRTLLEHVWADFSHKMIYKKGYRVPATWERELAKHAALLEEADTLLLHIQRGLEVYTRSYGSYLTKQQMQKELEILTNVLEYNPTNLDIITQIGRIAINMGEWKKAVDILSPHNHAKYPPLLRDLGIALCHIHRKHPQRAEYTTGLKYLEDSVNTSPADAFALSTLADSWAVLDGERAQHLYQQAFEADPHNAYPLSYSLAYQILARKDLSLITMMRPVIEKALHRCRELANVGIDLPWAFYDFGFLHLLLGNPYKSIASYAKALEVTPDDWMAQKASNLVEKLSPLQEMIEGYDWVRTLLMLGLAVKFPTSTRKKKIARLPTPMVELKEPIVIVAGETLDADQTFLEEYSPLVQNAFREFSGTIICGGTTNGISGLVGELIDVYPERITTIGYVPQRNGGECAIHSRYTHIVSVGGEQFSPREPLHYWINILNHRIEPPRIKVLGIGGGPIASSEYRIALALGATVGILEGSGREAAKLLIDGDWRTSRNLIPLPRDAMTIQAFIGTGKPRLPFSKRERIAQNIHKEYLDTQIIQLRKAQPSTKDWGELEENLKESNRLQADHIEQKLKTIGCSIRKQRIQDIHHIMFNNEEIEIMAEMEHGRWNAERLVDGWRWGKDKDVAKKINPYLVPWSDLPEPVKEWDRDTVRKIPQFLADIGYEVFRVKKNL